MSTTITSENGVEIKVAQLGMGVVHPEGIASIWARLSQEQRRALADALVPGRDFSGVNWKTMFEHEIRNRVAAVALLRRERDEALRKKGEAFDRAVRAERERDAAVARADQLRDERDEALSAGLEALGAAERDRDEWKARAEQAERERDQARDDERLHAWGRITRHPFFDRCQFGGGTLTESVLAALDEATQPAPAVTRADIEKALRRAFTEDLGLMRTTNAVWSLVSGDDPAVHVVRESQVEAVEVESGARKWIADGEAIGDVSNGPDWVREPIGAYLRWVAGAEAVARAIEAESEQDVDPVEEQTDSLADILYGNELVTDQMRGVLERVVRAGMLFPGLEASSDE